MIIHKNDVTVILAKEEIEVLRKVEKILNEIHNVIDCDSHYRSYDESDFWRGYDSLRELTEDTKNDNQTIVIKSLGY